MTPLEHDMSYLQTLKWIRKSNFFVMPLCILFQWLPTFQVGFSGWMLILPTIVTVGLAVFWTQSHRQLTKQIQSKTLDIVRRRLAGEL